MITFELIIGIIIFIIGLLIIIYKKNYAKVYGIWTNNFTLNRFAKIPKKTVNRWGVINAFILGVAMMLVGLILIVLSLLNYRISGM